VSISYDDFIRVVQEHDGKELKTVKHGAPFRLKCTAHGVSFTPTISGKKRSVNSDDIKSYLDVYDRTHSMVTSDYNRGNHRNASYVLAIIKLILRQQPDTLSTLTADLRSILRQCVDRTTEETLIYARVGQGRFRTDVLRIWGNRCAVTGSQTEDAIRASHIKPWSKSTDAERLDPNNGLPLVANLDALFDAGLISFESLGKMLVSPRLSASERQKLGLGELSLTSPPTTETMGYLAYHRDKKFKGN
jgi:predicted restriction endonuclease